MCYALTLCLTVSVWESITPQVTLQQPAQAKVSEAADATNDEMLVDAALDLFAGIGKGGAEGTGGAGDASKASATTLEAVKTGVSGVVQGPTNHLVRLERSGG